MYRHVNKLVTQCEHFLCPFYFASARKDNFFERIDDDVRDNEEHYREERDGKNDRIRCNIALPDLIRGNDRHDDHGPHDHKEKSGARPDRNIEFSALFDDVQLMQHVFHGKEWL